VLLGRGLLDGLFPCSEESYKCLSDLRVVCCQLHVCATGRFLVQRSRMDVCLLGNLCVVRYRSVRRADPFYRGVVWMCV